VKPLLEAVLSSPNADVRRFAAERLLQYRRSEALLASAGSQDPKVRDAAARALRCHEIRLLSFNGTSTSENREQACPTVVGADRETLVRLVADPDADVRAEAATSVSQLEMPLDWSVYESMAKDADSRVRGALLFAKNVPMENRARIAMTLATDKDPKVLQGFDEFLFGELAPQSPSAEYTGIDPVFYPVIEARRLNPVRPFEENAKPSQKSRLFDILGQRTEGLQSMIQWAARENDSPLLERVTLKLFNSLDAGNTGSSRRAHTPAELGLGSVTPETWVALFEAAHKSSKEGIAESLTRVLVVFGIDLSKQLLPVARDASRSLRTRLDACDVAANGRDPELVPVLRSLLDDPAWNVKFDSWGETSAVMSIAIALPDQSAAKDLDSVLADAAMPAPFGMAFVAGWVRSHEIDARQAGIVLDRWLSARGGQQGGIEAALKKIGSLPRDLQRDWIVRAAHDARYVGKALTLIGDMRDPSYLTVLEEFLSPGFELKGAGDVQTGALNALTRYFDDRAADLILKVAGSTASATLRDACFKALETIRKYQEEKGRWKDERSSGEAWTKSVADLVALLDDPDATVRVQALRGLGTLGAKQEMPRVVRMLKDKDESVRKAAEDALGALNASPK
jgi:HEAT repeat protein